VDVFARTPTLYLLGIVTFVRLVECGAEDFQYGLAINRIRHYYKEVAGDRADLFLLSGHDDGVGVFANMAASRRPQALLRLLDSDPRDRQRGRRGWRSRSPPAP
jgi:hypothetical protein